MGVDGIMLNEHHNAPFCMSANINVMASVLASATKRVKIVLLGYPLPICDNPVRIAEEIATADLISKGRVVSGFVRGGGVESLSTNGNPAFNRERFEEAHDLIVKTWTQPGPFRWEGKHYQLRVVNPWVLPLQQPHPRIWIPGVSSRETVIWAAERKYPYIALNVSLKDAKSIWSLYDETAQRVGYTAGPEHRGYLVRCAVRETEEKAIEHARHFMWMQGEFTGLGHPVWAAPSGYLGAWARKSMAKVRVGSGRAGRGNMRERRSFEEMLADDSIIAGTPEQVVRKLRVFLEATRPPILVLFGNDGKVTHEDSMKSIRLLGQEVMPALREIGKELGLHSPFELNSPVSMAASRQPSMVALGAQRSL